MRRRGWGRQWAWVWAVLQFALPLGATYADALLDRAAATRQAHVEDHARASCLPAHGDDCALCHVVARLVLPTVPAARPAILRTVASTTSSHVPLSGGGLAGAPSLPRAPPTA